ncbi:MAG: LamG-like jellyroll fold domain-containing protein, partial [Bacteroidales bacterium]
QAADRYHAIAIGVDRVDDPRGVSEAAYRFSSGQDMIFTPNHPDLNFGQALSASCWFRCDQLDSERFILSHGSWQQRYKLSVIPEGYLRWTVKTANGVADLDTPEPIVLNRWYHVTTLYTGYSMELYLDGDLVAFRSFSGLLLSSDKSFTIGRMDEDETQYVWRGSIDEVRLWNEEIPVSQIRELRNQWLEVHSIDGELVDVIYPNPSLDGFRVQFTGDAVGASLELFDLQGSSIRKVIVTDGDQSAFVPTTDTPSGLYLLRLQLPDGRQAVRKVILRK